MKLLYDATRKPKGERCDLCSLPLAERHDHLFDPAARKVACACTGCAMISPGRYRRVPDHRERVAIDATAWLARLGVPVGIAAIVVGDDGRARIGFPGPAGLVESELDPELWRELSAQLPPLAPEVEAIVCSNIHTRGAWHVGIDVLFEMVSELRASWRGMTGGPDISAAALRVLEAV